MGRGNKRSVRQWFGQRTLLQEAEEDLADKLRLSSVEAEREFVEVGLEMAMLHATVMSADQPALEQSNDPVHVGQQAGRSGVIGPDHLSAMTISLAPKSLVAPPPVCDDLAAGLNRLFNEWDQCLGGEVLDLAQSNAADLLARDLHRDGKSRFLSTFPPDAARFNTSEKRIVDLNNAAQSLPPCANHGTTKLVQPGPGSLVALESEKALQTFGASPCLLGADPPDGQEPLSQRLSGAFQDRSCSEGSLSAALRALNVVPTVGPPLAVATDWTPVSLWPPDLKEVCPAGLLRAESLLELDERCGKVVLTHASMLYVVVT